MPELVKIPAATAEIVARFDRPYIGLLIGERVRVKVLESLVTALLPFGFRLANTEIVASGKTADQKVVFRIPDRGITFQFGAEEYRFTKEGAAWSTSEEDGSVWNAAETALLTESGAMVAACTATLAMHVVPLSKTRDEVIAPFICPPFKQFTGQVPKAFGAHIRFADRREILLDYSLGYANGIFLRFSSELNGKPTIREILATMQSDEQQVFEILDIQDESETNQ